MKRSKVLDIIEEEVLNYEMHKSMGVEVRAEDTAKDILSRLEAIGMLPPTSTCKLVEDTYRGGLKHSEVGHWWDEE